LLRVLLVDDNPAQLQARAAVLSRAGCEVFTATSAPAALALLRSGPGASIATVVTDHVMPEVSGALFVRELRRVRPAVRVVVVSGLPGAQDEYAGLDVCFRQKPCPPEELIALVQAPDPS
jgi:DNA-binding response OmpR family regulator